MNRIIKWGAYEGTDTHTHVVVHRAEPIMVEALVLDAAIITDLDGEGDLGLEVVATSGDVELARRTEWGLGIFGPPVEAHNTATLRGILNEWIPQIVHQAHQNARTYLTETEARLKALREINNALRFVTLEHEDKRVRLTLEMAHLVLMLGDKQAQKPYHLERLAGHLAACFNCVGRPYAYIAFNPDVAEYHQGVIGRFGLYSVPGPTETI